MTSPLIYIFAGVACALALWFLLAVGLSYLHTRTRTRRAAELTDYIAYRRIPLPGAPVRPATTRHQRARVMHTSIGDLIRDASVAAAVVEGISENPQRSDAAPEL